MRHAILIHRTNLKPLPSQHVSIQPQLRTFNADEMRRIRRGRSPASTNSEEKWFIYHNRGRLYFHDNATGCCIYVATFAREENDHRMVSLTVNTNPKQNTAAEADHAAEIGNIIDLLLLRTGTLREDER